MKRRNFIKTTAAGSAFLLTSGAYSFNETKKQIPNKKYGFQSERKIPVAYNVDVVVGGSMAAVASAVEASRAVQKYSLPHRNPIWAKTFAELTGCGPTKNPY